MDMVALHAVWAFNIPQAVPLEGTISFEELTAKIEELNTLPISVSTVRRLLRLAMTNYIFTEPVKNHVAHTRTSRLLLQDPSVASQVGLICDHLWLPVASAVGAMKKWPASEEPNHSAINLAYNQDLSWFDFLNQKENKELSDRYNSSVKGYGEAAMSGLDQCVTGYPWGDLGQATVVDVSQSRIPARAMCRVLANNCSSRWVAIKET